MAELHIDWTACRARGLCTELLPELMTTDPWGYPLVHRGRVPDELVEHAQRAVALCPRLALSLRQERDQSTSTGSESSPYTMDSSRNASSSGRTASRSLGNRLSSAG